MVDPIMKYRLAESIDDSDFNFSDPSFYEIAGVCLSLNYSGRNETKVKSFLSQYLNTFKTNSLIPDVEIFYQVPSNETGDDEWDLWNNWPHEIELIKSKKGNLIIERDFVGLVNHESNKIFCYGPQWSQATCDSIDNLLVYSIGLHSLKYNSFFLHAACISDGTFAYVFFGASGAGKSTLAEFSYKTEGLKVLSSDQIILRVVDDKVYAQVSPTTIPEFPLNHAAREMQILEVRSIVHLVQKNTGFSLKTLKSEDWLPLFMRELIFRSEFHYSNKLLDLSIKISKLPLIYKGEMSYPKDSRFWPLFIESI